MHEPLLARLAARFEVWAIQIVDAAERALPDLGLVRFHDMASGQGVWLDTARASVRSACQSAFARRLRRRRRAWSAPGCGISR
jgi:hypothetical protein